MSKTIGISNGPSGFIWLALAAMLVSSVSASAGVASGAAYGSEHPRLRLEVYARAERFMAWNADQLTRDLAPDYHWIGDTNRFWYARQPEAGGTEFVIVDAPSGKRHPAFDHVLIARGLSAALGKSIDARHLPFKTFELVSPNAINVTVDGKDWRCSLTGSGCIAAECSAQCAARRAGGVVSPNGNWAAFLDGYNISVRSLRDQSERQLTHDGAKLYAYGAFSGTGGSMGMRPATQKYPVALWSPDSKRLLTERLDERKVLDLNLLETVPSTGVRPILHSIPYAFPGDADQPSEQLIIFDVKSGRRVDVSHAPFPVTYIGPIEDDRVWWSADSETAYVVPREEGEKQEELVAIHAGSGTAQVLIEERGKTYVEIAGDEDDRTVRTLSDGRIIWYSERSDWGHLYLYSAQGKLIRPLTSGAWKVMKIVRVDERRRTVYFTAVGREPDEDPYQRHLYVVNLDGTGLRLLTPENADHAIRMAGPEIYCNLMMPSASGPAQASFSPSGRYFVETYSRPDLPSVTVLRSAAGRLLETLEHADISALRAGGLTMPQPFSVLAADGNTRLYGTIYRPSDFDPSKTYPVIDQIYGGPQALVTPKTFEGAVFSEAQPLAELGFIVINIDGRGTPFRSKSFHDVSYGHLEQAGDLDDHIAGIRELAARYPYMDLTRVGVTGWSGGGFASTRAILAYPDFYKVAVSIAGNHDERGYLLAWGPTYQGPYMGSNYDELINARLAGNLKGKLFLMHGEMDDNVPPALTMQLAYALVQANKDFDFLLIPGQDHEMNGVIGYVTRRRWDYFVRNLLGGEPPEDFMISVPQD